MAGDSLRRSRRVPLALLATTLLAGGASVRLAWNAAAQTRIDRRALVTRHNPTLRAPDRLSPFSLGNGEVMRSWRFDRTWGWDYPLIAMTAARVGEPELAIEALLMETQKNTYLASGHNYQDPRLTVYLPGNGGLLMAAAMMVAGWDGAPDGPAPGFPRDGRWVVRWEGLQRMP